MKGSPKICVSITEKDSTRAAESIRRIERYEPDLVELRIDYMQQPLDLESVRNTTKLPIIATNRSSDQGGILHRPDAERLATLLEACDAGFDYVDLELNTSSKEGFVDYVKDAGVKLIISYHDFKGTPKKDLFIEILNREIELGADVCKIVGTAVSPMDNITYLVFLAETPENDLVCFSMGRQGVMSRIFSPLFGGAFTYASTQSGMESAPGQLTIADLRKIYRMLGI